MTAVMIALLLILPITALAARRLPVHDVVKLALVWVAIFAVLVGAAVLWQQVLRHISIPANPS